MLVTDGLLDLGAAEADVRTLLEEVVDLHPREVVRVLGQCRARDRRRREPSDDATLLALDWYGDPDTPRGASAGATDDRASG